MPSSKYLKLVGLKVYDLDARYIGTVTDIGLMSKEEGDLQLYLVVSKGSENMAIPVKSIHSVGDIILLREGYEAEAIEQQASAPGISTAVSAEPSTVTAHAEALNSPRVQSGAEKHVIPRCPSCGSALIYEPRKKQWYCPRCKKYVKIPAEVEAKVPRCPSCGLPLSYIEEYGKWYCYNCRRYVDVE
ncbi:hypothetical protein PYJP_06720 [Pyrofollis japonicus]|uniref:YfgJ family double zinc ribbon protein n=1 Tax=Pyrofollis japonicus TaxID=3060460 RepID=UPI00295B76A4|nr:zinc-ribbon domain-containing protein [Pyrofollis japonicus]BEP17320.1 hypothetical protein PYJP_06720 [Pyrofollis japonicus]